LSLEGRINTEKLIDRQTKRMKDRQKKVAV
jgi:hypothetical protein